MKERASWRFGARRAMPSGAQALIGDFDGEIELAIGEIDAFANHDDRVEVLCQLRGVGRYTAMLVVAEAGGISRFASARKRAGLTATVHSSDGKPRRGRGGGPLRDSVEPIAKRRGRKIAKVAVARNDSHPLLLRPAGRRDPTPGGLRPRRSGELGILHGLRS
jgi:hypothetical protein